MNVSLNFVKRYVDLPAELTPEQISYDLTMRTVEVESITNAADKFENIVVGEIKEVKAHPNADALRICIVDCGEDELKQIVCGGSNLEPGQKVVVSKPGAMVVWHGEGEPVKIKETKMRGEASYGMICGASEVYLSDYFPTDDEKVIVDLAGYDCTPGQNIAELIGMDDIILEIDNKSLTNRPDLWGHYGIARELAAIYECELKPIDDFEIDKNLPAYPVEIEAPDKCYRYTGTEIHNVYVKDSPTWLKTLITNAGMRPINAIVDITNFIMLSVGQPTHAFDLSHVEGGKIVVRNAKKGETLTLLDRSELDLTEDDLVICDAVEPMGLAGIKGGIKDSILPDTKDVLLEVASFTKETIRKTGRRFDEKTDSSIRYEKGIDTQRVDLGLAVGLKLFKEIYPDCEIVAFGDNYPVKTENAKICVPKEFLDIRLGKHLEDDEIMTVLHRLGFEVKLNGDCFDVTSPTWRSTGDVHLKDDVLGELARLIGYENFESKPLPVNFEHAVKQNEVSLHRRIREFLAFRCGFNEIFSYPWIDEKYIKAAKCDMDKAVRLATPPAPELSYLRQSLIPGMLEAIEKNLRYYDEFRIFESAQVFEKGEYHPSSEDETLPVHKNLITGAIVGKDAKELFFKLKGVIESLPSYCHCEPDGISFKQVEKPSWADEKVWLNVYSKKKLLGSIGLISFSALSEAGIKRHNAAAFEIDLDMLEPQPSRTNEFKHLPQYPLVDKDLSILVSESTTWSEIREAIKYMVKELKFVEEYRGEQVPEGFKSVMLSLKIGNDDSTMTAKQIDKKMGGIIKLLENKCGAVLREE